MNSSQYMAKHDWDCYNLLQFDLLAFSPSREEGTAAMYF